MPGERDVPLRGVGGFLDAARRERTLETRTLREPPACRPSRWHRPCVTLTPSFGDPCELALILLSPEERSPACLCTDLLEFCSALPPGCTCLPGRVASRGGRTLFLPSCSSLSAGLR